jgi:hypothetical protein
MQLVQRASGKLTGTGAVINVKLGFRPRYVRLWNSTNKSIAEFFDGMTDAHFLAVIDSGVGTTDLSEVTTNGITLTSQGFQIGTSASINNNNDTIWYLAL